MADPPGRFTATNVPAQELIEFAWQLQSFQVDGGPDWIKSDRFDVVAKTGPVDPPAPGQPAAVQPMLRSLLADRFGLIVHYEPKERPVYSLTRVGESRLGPNLRLDELDCEKFRTTRLRGGAACGWRNVQGRLSIVGQPIAVFAQLLSVILHRPVIDHTGLMGSYDIDVTYATDETSSQQTPASTNEPNIFTAVREQLGLTLEATTGPIRMLVIDQAKKPTPD